MHKSNIDKISDFSDKINPVLVKELRQGMQGIGFILLFLALQALLCFILLITAADPFDSSSGSVISRIIFFFFSAAVLIFQPLRGISSLTTEIKGNTLDLLSMTRLNAWKITYGKWLSIVSQSALLLITIFPYLILRYFFGDMQMFAEILLLLTIFIISAGLTAIAVALSSINAVLIRSIAPMLAAVFGSLYILGIFSNSYGYNHIINLMSLDSSTSISIYIGVIVSIIYLAWLSLDFGASVIAPTSENRSTRRRIISMLFIGACTLAFVITDMDVTGALILSSIAVVPIIIISLSERDYLPIPTALAFTKKGVFGKLIGRVLYPGWHTGVIYTCIIGIILHVMLFLIKDSAYSYSNYHEYMIILNSVLGTLIFPAALASIFYKKRERTIVQYMTFLAGSIGLTLIVFITTEATNQSDLMQILFWLPFANLFILEENLLNGLLFVISCINIAVYLAILFYMSRASWKELRATERQVSEL